MSKTYDAAILFGQGIHEMGTPEWERDPKTSVLNGNTSMDAKMSFVQRRSLYDFLQSSTEILLTYDGSDS